MIKVENLPSLSSEIKDRINSFVDKIHESKDDFLQLIVMALIEIDRDWRTKPDLEKKQMFEHVCSQIKSEVVDPRFIKGSVKKRIKGKKYLSLNTFNRYKRTVANRMSYNVDWVTAEKYSVARFKTAKFLASGGQPEAEHIKINNNFARAYNFYNKKLNDIPKSSHQVKMQLALDVLEQQSKMNKRCQKKLLPFPNKDNMPSVLKEVCGYIGNISSQHIDKTQAQLKVRIMRDIKLLLG